MTGPHQKSSYQSLTVDQVLETMSVDPRRGLTDRDIRRRLDRHGPNRSRKAKRRSIWKILAEQFKSMVIVVLGALMIVFYWLNFDQRHAVTISFLTLAFAKLWFVFNLRRPGSSLFSNDIVKNPYIGGSIMLCAFLLLAAVYLPGLSDLLKTENPTWLGWLVVLGMSLVPFVFGQAMRIIQKCVVTGE